MISVMLENWNMSKDVTTFPQATRVREFGEILELKSICISWIASTPSPDSKITLYGINGSDSKTILYSATLGVQTNIEDALLIILESNFQNISLKYEAESVSGGKLNVTLYYR